MELLPQDLHSLRELLALLAGLYDQALEDLLDALEVLLLEEVWIYVNQTVLSPRIYYLLLKNRHPLIK